MEWINGVNQILINLGNVVSNSMTNYKKAFKRAKENMDTKQKLKNVFFYKT